MCTIQNFCCYCSLSTGVMFISIVNLLTSFFPCLSEEITWFVKYSNLVSSSPPVDSMLELSRIYYVITACVSFGALIGVLSATRWWLIFLQTWDICRLIIALESMILMVGTSRGGLWFLIAAVLVYCVSVEYSYYKELKNGHPHSGVVLTPATTVTVCTATAPSASELPSEQHQFIASPAPAQVALPKEYTVQQPYAENFDYQQPYYHAPPVTFAYPPSHPPFAAAPQSNVPNSSQAQFGTLPFPQGAPPPYPVSQTAKYGENPPPYAP